MTASVRELLLLHHTHTDIGYTHSQPALWELQCQFIDKALDLCERTADAPPEERFHWTCECTAPLELWLESASSTSIERFRDAVCRGQLGAGALHLHYTPLVTAADLLESLRALPRLREVLGLPLKVAISHDVNGLPWPVVSLLRQSGVELLIMGVNILYGGHPLTRPLVFDWEGPAGNPLLTFNAEHYNAFGRETAWHLEDPFRMETGLQAFLGHTLPSAWPYDFAFLTATHPRFGDNNPPSPTLLRTIRRWNAAKRPPFIRLIQPEVLLDRIRQSPAPIPRHSGDWTDFWNFGAGSSARETALNRQNQARIQTIDLLGAAIPVPHPRTTASLARARASALLWNEHTWTAAQSLGSNSPEQLAGQWTHKAATAWTAHSLSHFCLREHLESLAHPEGWEGEPAGLLVCNPSPVPRHEALRLPRLIAASIQKETVPPGSTEPLKDGQSTPELRTWDHLSSRFHQLDQFDDTPDGTTVRTQLLELPPASLRWIPFSSLTFPTNDSTPLDPASGKASCNGLTLTWDTASGTILTAGRTGSKAALRAGTHPVFGFLRESPLGLHEEAEFGGREAFYKFDWDEVHANIPGWKTGWAARREGPGTLHHLSLADTPEGVCLTQERAAPGVGNLVQRAILRRDRPAITFEASFTMGPSTLPEGIYFVFPTNLEAGWRAHYDTADLPLELEAEQLPGTNLDFVTVGRWICLHGPGGGIQLTCPDAPLVQVGDFSFGRRRNSIPRPRDPLLAAWATNNYWMTNFRPSQSGPVRLRYEVSFHETPDPVTCTHAAAHICESVSWHPLMGSCSNRTEVLADVTPNCVRLLSLRRLEGGMELLLANVSSTSVQASVSLPLTATPSWNGTLGSREIRLIPVS